MQIQPDYSHQLEEIAKALNRPSTAPWVVALISVLFGFLLGMAGQWLMKVIDNRRDIHKMRRVLYLDLLRIFQRINYAMKNQFWIQQEQLKRDMKFDGETYLKGHHDIFMQLPERQRAERLYGLYHLILDESACRGRHPTECSVANHRTGKVQNTEIKYHQWVAVTILIFNFVKFQRKYIRKFLGRAEAEELLKKLTATTEPKDRK